MQRRHKGSIDLVDPPHGAGSGYQHHISTPSIRSRTSSPFSRSHPEWHSPASVHDTASVRIPNSDQPSIRIAHPQDVRDLLDLVALRTICRISPLAAENRIYRRRRSGCGEAVGRITATSSVTLVSGVENAIVTSMRGPSRGSSRAAGSAPGHCSAPRSPHRAFSSQTPRRRAAHARQTQRRAIRTA